jgi:hypothetical protein
MASPCGAVAPAYGWNRSCRGAKLRGCGFDGGFFAVVEVVAGSANGRSQLAMQLWCEPTMITTDVTGLEHFTRLEIADERFGACPTAVVSHN